MRELAPSRAPLSNRCCVLLKGLLEYKPVTQINNRKASIKQERHERVRSHSAELT